MSTSVAPVPVHARSVHARPVPPAGAGSASVRRDGAVDVVRAVCLTVVVVLHALMVGVSVGPRGPVLENALDHWAFFPAASWLVQVMPLFFILGGFSAYGQWSRLREAGGGYGDYLAGRLRRLLSPALTAIAAAAVLLSALALLGVPAADVAVAGFRLSQPLWFLGVYVLCTAAVPLLVAAHDRRPVASLATLVTLALAVDVLRAATGIAAIGFVNLLFVWLLVQQLGFWLASGRLDALRRGALAAIVAVALGLAVVGAASGLWSPDMYAALNPPATALALLGTAQLAVFLLLRHRLRTVSARPVIGRIVDVVNRRAMTVYSWHMLALIMLAGLLLVSGLALPAPLSALWWASRPLWLAVVVAAVAGLVAVAARAERGSAAATPRVTVSALRAAAAAACGAGGVLVVLLAGSSTAGWVAGAALVFAALRIPRGSRVATALSR
ncbi:acyltransferase [Leifsonia shinshuensis]|uniref:acyltransferase family protein n=1 Tax=Leifsonia shinshuensis TaxID=150026 RepID=UPI001F50DBB5|nr:acyltransferase [Leifsonia shinshuensis]MCI0155612.1 acyltransferase [Leifsonia shinshuensis]